MRPNMSEKMKTTDSTTFVVASTEGNLAGDPRRSRPYKKYAIIAVSCILALAISLTAVLVWMHLFAEAQKDIVQFSFNLDAKTKEEVTSVPNANIVQYHVTSYTYEAWVINDSNRDIQVMKIHSESGTVCYLTPLNRTIANEPAKVSPPSGNQRTNATYVLTYRSTKTPISDSAFICQTARNACKGISTYWLFPSCEGCDGVAGRQKRSTEFGSFCLGLRVGVGDVDVCNGINF